MMESMVAAIKLSTHQMREEFAPLEITGTPVPFLNRIPKGCIERTERAHGENYEKINSRLRPGFCCG